MKHNCIALVIFTNGIHNIPVEVIMRTVILTSIVAFGLAIQPLAAAEVEVSWENPDDFSDVKPVNQSRKRFQQRVFNQFEEYIQELSEELPENQRLEINVTNLDLAGKVWPGSFVGLGHSAANVRLIKSIDIPRMDFSYQLKDQQGQVLQSAEVKLKDMAFQDRIANRLRNDSLRYEKMMFKRWFDETLLAEQTELDNS
jgi:hypothetical protein